jgi:SNF2 family DNA or RNA helicase
MPAIGTFEASYANGRDRFGNLTFNSSATQRFAQDYFLKLTMRRRKTDPEIIDQFPQLIEKKVAASLTGDHRHFYTAVEALFDPPEGEEDKRTEDQIISDALKLAGPLRLTAGHPAAHLHVDNDVSRQIVEMVGAEGLRAIGSCKTDELISRLKPLIKGQRSQALLFEFHTSVIVEVARELREAGFTVAEYHGRQSNRDNEHAKQMFLDGEVEILFASDKAARGMNFQNAEYTFEYSPAFTYAVHAQRINRANRIDSQLPSNTCITMVLEDTIDEDTLAKMVARNRDQDALTGDDVDAEAGFVTAEERRVLLQAYRRRRN